MNRPLVIQLFIYANNEHLDVYIIDENGSLHIQRTERCNAQSLISHYNLFISSILSRRNELLGDSRLPVEEIETQYYILKKDSSWSAQIIEVKPEFNNGKYFNIQVIGDLNDENQHSLSIFCNDREFSSLEYGNEIFDYVAKYVLEQRRNGNRYPIYLTDIDISRSLYSSSGFDSPQTIYFLKYKKRIENKLNRALSGIHSGQ